MRNSDLPSSIAPVCCHHSCMRRASRFWKNPLPGGPAFRGTCRRHKSWFVWWTPGWPEVSWREWIVSEAMDG